MDKKKRNKLIAYAVSYFLLIAFAVYATAESQKMAAKFPEGTAPPSNPAAIWLPLLILFGITWPLEIFVQDERLKKVVNRGTSAIALIIIIVSMVYNCRGIEF